MKRKYPVFDFLAAMAFVFDVDWDTDFPSELELGNGVEITAVKGGERLPAREYGMDAV